MTDSDERKVFASRLIAATPERLFEAWTTPAQLLSWWGPDPVHCSHAEVDLRVGGRYRLGNQMPDGRVVYLVGEFLAVQPPTELIYTWAIEREGRGNERVTVRFEARGELTEVTVLHERIPHIGYQREHAAGWDGCLDSLVLYVRS